MVPTVVAVLAFAAIAHDVYTRTWRPAADVAGSYERRLPGEFAKEEDRFVFSALEDPREFQFLPPAPVKPGLVKFTSPWRGALYVDGLPVSTVTLQKKAGCVVVHVGCTALTKSACPV